MAQTATLLTAEDLYRLPSSLRCELIDGELIELSPPGAEHGELSGNVLVPLHVHVRTNHLGVVMDEVGFILRRNPDTVRAPDVAFVRADRIPATGVPRGFWEIAPDLAVEVVSPWDTMTEVRTKVREWMEAGARLVWIINPRSRTVEVVRSLVDRRTLDIEDILDGEDVVPGFRCPVAEIFQNH